MAGRRIVVWGAGLALAGLATVFVCRSPRRGPGAPLALPESKHLVWSAGPGTPGYWFDHYLPLPFDAELWKEGDPWVRFSMLNDLLERHPLQGKSAREVEALLGPLEQGWQSAGGMTYVYWVEHTTGFEPGRDTLLDSGEPLPAKIRRAKALLVDLDGEGRVRGQRFLD